VADNKQGWSKKHHHVVSVSLLGRFAVDRKTLKLKEVKASHVKSLLEIPIEHLKDEDVQAALKKMIASGETLHLVARLAGRIEQAWRFAKASKWIKHANNPAQWADIKAALGSAAKAGCETESFAAMSWRDLPAFMAQLRKVGDQDLALSLDPTIAMAIEWIALCACACRVSCHAVMMASSA
jgi:hypothetical protein